MSGKINTNDLIDDSGNLDKLFEDLKRVRGEYLDLVKVVKKNAASLKGIIGQSNAGSSAGRSAISKNIKQVEQLAAEHEKYKKALAKTKTEFEKYKKLKAAQAEINKKANKSIQEETAALKKLTSEIKRAKSQQIKSSKKAEEAINREKKALARLSANIKKAKDRLTQLAAQQKQNTATSNKLTASSNRYGKSADALLRKQKQLTIQLQRSKEEFASLTKKEQESTQAKEYQAQVTDRLTKEIKELESVTGRKISTSNKEEKSIDSLIRKQRSLTRQLALSEKEFSRLPRSVRNSAKAKDYHKRSTEQLKKKITELAAVTGREIAVNERAKKSYSSTGDTIKRLIATYLSFEAAKAAIESTFRITKQLDGLNLAYEKTISNSAELAQTNLFLSKTADDFGLDVLALRKSYLKYNAAASASSLSTKEIQDIFKSTSKSISILGLSTEESNRAFTAFSQILSKGTVQSEEIKGQLGDVLPGALQILANSLNKTTAELLKMMENGEIMADEALPKFAAELEKAYGIENVDRIDNLAAAQGRYNTGLTELINELDGAGIFKDFFNTIAAGLKFIKNNLSAILNLTKAVVVITAAYGAWRTGLFLTNLAKKESVALTYAQITGNGLLTTSTLLTKRAFDALKLAMISNPFGAVLTAITLVVGAFVAFSGEVEKSKDAVQSLNEETTAAVAKEEAALYKLTAVAKGEKTSKEDRAKAIKAINELSPEYLGALNAETVKSGEAKDAIDKYVQSIYFKNRAQIASIKLDELQAQRQEDLQNGLAGGVSKFDIIKKGFSNLFTGKGVNSFSSAAAELLSKDAKEYTNTVTELEKQRLAAESALEDLLNPTKNPTNKSSLSEEDLIKKEELRLSVLEDGQEKELALLALSFKKKRIEFKKEGVSTNGLAEQFERERLLIVNKYKQEELDLQRDIENLKISALEKGEKKDLALLEVSFQKRKAEFEKYELSTKQITEQNKIDKLKIEEKYQALILESQDRAERERIALEETGINEELALLDLEYKIKLRSVTNKIALDKQYERERSRLEDAAIKEAYEKELAAFDESQELKRSEFESIKQTEQDKSEFTLTAEKERLEKILELNRRFGGVISDTQREILQNQIEGITNELEGLGESSSDIDIYSLFGFKIDDEKKQAIQKATDFIKGQFQSLFDTRAKLAEQSVTAANQEIDRTQRQLQIEIESRNAGFAHSSETALKELNEAKANQKEALKEQRKAQIAQQGIQTVEQAVSLSTASANIWKSFSPLGPIGVFAAVTAITTMFGSFISSKAKASQLSKKEFKDGGYEIVGGGTHASGNDTALGFEVDGKQAYAEKDEGHIIIPATKTRKQSSILPAVANALIRGTFADTYANINELGPKGDVLINVQSPQSSGRNQGERDPALQRIDKNIAAMKKQGETRYVTNKEGEVVEIRKGVVITHK